MSEARDYISYQDETGSVNISEDVLAVIAGGAALEVEGVHSLYPGQGRDISELVSKKTLARSVRTEIDGQSVEIHISLMVELGAAIGQVGEQVQKAVIEAVEASIGVKPAAVNVHISGISLKKK